MNLRPKKLLISGLVALPLAFGCGASDAHKIVTPRITELAQAICEIAYRCCTPGEVGFYTGPFVTKDTCAKRLVDSTLLSPSFGLTLPQFHGLSVLVPNLGALDRAIRDGRTLVDGAALAACLAYLDELECNTPPVKEPDPKVCKPADPPPEPTPCAPAKLFVGKLKEGDACTSGGSPTSSDTTPGPIDVPGGGDPGGLSPLALGTPTLPRTLECGPGLVCARNPLLGEKGQCVSPGQAGDLCFHDMECADGLYCSFLDGRCREPQKEGATCAYSDRGDSPDPSTLLVACEPGLSCDPITDTCVARCQQGAGCSTDDDCDEDQQLRCITGRCDKPRKATLPCTSHEDCEKGLYCGLDPASAGTGTPRSICLVQLLVGDPCEDHPQCEAGFCDPTAGSPVCARQAVTNDPCPTGMDEECEGGWCQGGAFGYCTADTDCETNRCDLLRNACESVCQPLQPDGADCTAARECESRECVAGSCQTTPLTDGTECDDDSQCESEFCGLEATRRCTRLPLPNGDPCTSGSQCESLVCFYSPLSTQGATCTDGLGEGEPCGQASGIRDCDPWTLFCDGRLEPPRCALLHEAGEACEDSSECRGSCQVKMGRKVCDATPKPDAEICDGVI